MTGMERFGIALRRKRIEHKLSQERLGELADLNRTYINKIETGRIYRPEDETIDKLAAALGITTEELLANVEPPLMLREDRGAYAVDVEDDDLLQVYSRMSDGDRPVACRFHGDGAGWVERAVGSGFRHGGSILMSSNRIAIGGGGVRLVPARTPRSGPTVRPDITHGFGREVRRLGTATQPHWSLGVAANMLACQARDHGFESRRDRRRARRLRIVCRTISTALPTFLGLRMGAGERGALIGVAPFAFYGTRMGHRGLIRGQSESAGV